MTRNCQLKALAAAMAAALACALIALPFSKSANAASKHAGVKEQARVYKPGAKKSKRTTTSERATRSAASDQTKPSPEPQQQPAKMTLDIFLDRLMMAESGGRRYARNARSTALGPYQFIASTWLYLARTSFATETAELKSHEILGLRTDLAFARRAAKVYTEANAAHLVANGHTATFANLRLAFLVGPSGAVRVLSAKPDAPIRTVLGRTVIGANPFMRRMSASDLIARAARDVSADIAVDTGLTPSADAVRGIKTAAHSAEPVIAVRCKLSLPSCRRWVALAKRRATRRIRRASRD